MLNQGVGSWLERKRVKSQAHPVAIFHDQQLTYAQLADQANALAHALQEWGVGSGARVAYLGENHPSFLQTFFATTQIGAVFVPLNTRLSPPELNFQLLDSEVHVVVVSEALRTTAEAALPGSPVTQLVVVEDEFTQGLQGHPVLHGVNVSYLGKVTAEGSTTYVDHRVAQEDPAMVLYTSGTTGRPKGAVLTHGNLIWNSMNVLVDYDIVSTDVALMISPMFHVASLGMGVLPTILKGGTLVLEAGFEPGRVLELIEQYKATMISGVPTTYQMLCEHPNWPSTDISSLKKLTCGGSAVPLRVLEEYERRGLSFTGGYGMTETAPGATSLQPDRSKSKIGSAGLPHFFTSVRIATETDQPAPTGEVGEIQIQGPNVIGEYLKRPEASRDAFSADGWFKSGDMGYMDEEGFLFITDRLKDMIISGGENIYPAEIEQLILQNPDISAVAVIGVEDAKWGEVPLACVVMREGAQCDPEVIKSALFGNLAKYKIPKYFAQLDELPRTASGKIRKVDLKKLFPTAPTIPFIDLRTKEL